VQFVAIHAAALRQRLVFRLASEGRRKRLAHKRNIGCGAELFSAPYLLLSVLGTRNPGRTERIHFQCLNDFVPACDLQRAATQAKCVGHAQPVHQATPLYAYQRLDASGICTIFSAMKLPPTENGHSRWPFASNLMAITGLLKGLAAGPGRRLLSPDLCGSRIWRGLHRRAGGLVHWATSFASSTYPHALPAFP
jgi:hypothetical protein